MVRNWTAQGLGTQGRCASHWACTMLIKLHYINQGPLLSTMRSLLILSSHPSSWHFLALVQCTCEARLSFLGCPFNISSVGVCFVVCRTQASQTVGPWPCSLYYWEAPQWLGLHLSWFHVFWTLTCKSYITPNLEYVVLSNKFLNSWRCYLWRDIKLCPLIMEAKGLQCMIWGACVSPFILFCRFANYEVYVSKSWWQIWTSYFFKRHIVS